MRIACSLFFETEWYLMILALRKWTMVIQILELIIEKFLCWARGGQQIFEGCMEIEICSFDTWISNFNTRFASYLTSKIYSLFFTAFLFFYFKVHKGSKYLNNCSYNLFYQSQVSKSNHTLQLELRKYNHTCKYKNM